MRFIYSDNGSLSDFSQNLKKYKSGNNTFTLISAEDSLFIGQDVPFNHVYLKFSTPNVNTCNLSLSYWDGQEFHSAVEVVDETDGMKQDGFLSWVPDKNEQWDRESTNFDGESVTGLDTITIYDKYWLKIDSDADFSATTIDWVGNLFSSDDDLGTEFPDLVRTNFKIAFESGKTSWEEQHVRAAEVIIKDLKSMNVIAHEGEILDKDEFTLASVYKVAEIVYNALGDDYVDQKLEARKEYFSRLKKGVYKVDKDRDAIIDNGEKFKRVGFFSR